MNALSKLGQLRSSPRVARSVAHANIALVKYWGKRPGALPDLNLPAVGSLSMTLGELRTETEVGPSDAGDQFVLDGETITGPARSRSIQHLDRVWRAFGAPESRPRPTLYIRSRNHVPTAAGLASSASGFAALTLAASAALTTCFDGLSAPREVYGPLSALARRGSGSAARSLWGGFVRLDRGTHDDGSDCRARPLFARDHWDLELLVVHTAKGKKPVGSTDGMNRSRETSPYYAPWVDHSEADLDAAEAALGRRDLAALGDIVEHSCFKMHACMLATRPPILYWNGTTLEVIRALWEARARGLEGYATSDAGPHVKVLCRAETATALSESLAAVPGVLGIDRVAPGPDATVEVEL